MFTSVIISVIIRLTLSLLIGLSPLMTAGMLSEHGPHTLKTIRRGARLVMVLGHDVENASGHKQPHQDLEQLHASPHAGHNVQIPPRKQALRLPAPFQQVYCPLSQTLYENRLLPQAVTCAQDRYPTPGAYYWETVRQQT